MRYVYCHPLFDERKCSHRFSYRLAKDFERVGLKLERFDYPGTGESAGDFSQVTLDSLRADLTDFLRNDKTCLIGLRFGASLAMELAIRRPKEIEQLILIEPIVSGSDYVDYLYRKQHIKDMMTTGLRTIADGRYINLEGYKTGTVFIEQLRNFSLKVAVENYSAESPVTIIQTNGQSNGEFATLAASLANTGAYVSLVSANLGPFWERIPIEDYSPLTGKIIEVCHG